MEDTLGLLRESVRGVLGRHWSPHRAARPTDAELESMLRIAGEHGWTSLDAAEDTQAWAVVLEETGRAACPIPLRDAAVAALALEGGAAGMLAVPPAHVVVALGGAADERAAGVVEADAGGGDGTLRLRGVARLVEGAGLATHALVATEGAAAMALVDVRAAGVRIETVDALGGSLSSLRFDAAEAVAVPAGAAALDSMTALARLGCIARALGAAQRSFELALDHARTRHQFGGPIGRFQAIQHRLADCATALDACRLLVDAAAASRGHGRDDWQRSAAAAAAYGAPALRRVARDAQHVLAGVGYMEEHEAPRHFRRVFADTVRFGGAPAARARLAAACLHS